MRKSLTMNTLAMGNLRNRRKQYTLMILGIILAMVFSSTTIFFLSTFMESSLEQRRNRMGLQTDIVYDGQEDTHLIQAAKDMGLIKEYGQGHILGYAYHKDKNLGTCIGWLDQEAMKLAYHKLDAGAFPQKEGEIALEHAALLRLGYGKAQIGDTIQVTTQIQDGNNYYKKCKESYVLTGILKDKKKHLQEYEGGGQAYEEILIAGLVAPGTQVKAGGKEKLIFYAINDPASFRKVKLSLWDYFYDKAPDTMEILSLMEEASLGLMIRSDDFFHNFPVFLLMLVLTLTAAMTIVNAFATNLKDRRRQIGLLRAVGATRKQIVRIFLREALLIALAALPISILISYGLVRLLMPLLIAEPVFASGLKVLPICAVVNLAVTMLSALLPLGQAAKITPIQGIRDISNMRVMKQKHVKSAMHFTMPRLMAKRNLMFYKGGRLAVIIILAVSITISCYGFSSLRFSSKQQYQSNFDYVLTVDDYSYGPANWKTRNIGYDQDDLNTIQDLPHLTNLIGYKRLTALISCPDYNIYHTLLGEQNGYGRYDLMAVLDGNDTLEDMKAACQNMPESENYQDTMKTLHRDQDYVQTNLMAMDQEVLARLDTCLLDGAIHVDQLNSGKEVLLVASKSLHFGVNFENKYGSRTYSLYNENDRHMETMETILSADCSYHVGDQIEVSCYFYDSEDAQVQQPDSFKKVTKTLTIGGILDPDKCYDSMDYHLFDGSLITSTVGIKDFSSDLKYTQFNLLCDDGIGDEEDLEMTQAMEAIASQYNGNVRSLYGIRREDKQIHRSMMLSLFCIMILGMVICCSIINNNLTATIRENKRMLGTLRAVGASRSDLTQIYVKQLNSMFKSGLALGILNTAILFLTEWLQAKYNIYRTIVTLSFYPWPTLVMLVLLYAICAGNLWRTIGKEMKHSIVENIREL